MTVVYAVGLLLLSVGLLILMRHLREREHERFRERFAPYPTEPAADFLAHMVKKCAEDKPPNLMSCKVLDSYCKRTGGAAAGVPATACSIADSMLSSAAAQAPQPGK